MTRKAPGSGVRCDLVFMFGLMLVFVRVCVQTQRDCMCGLLAAAGEAERLLMGVALGGCGAVAAAAMFGGAAQAAALGVPGIIEGRDGLQEMELVPNRHKNILQTIGQQLSITAVQFVDGQTKRDHSQFHRIHQNTIVTAPRPFERIFCTH